ncbi:patatin-like phospholipase family protein [Myroides indicus]|uniref:NTE family protein n=1 Tax=Myroides indicus TaxID=1323422 RepID=A0A4R7EZC9_9FLAO|nr:NTE family protein [Myroides indicus]
MSTKKIGLVLSGGGYKGIAHAGALQFLKEQNITPSVIAGTSSGSIVSCLYACGMNPEEIFDFFKSVNIFDWHHFTFKKAGLINVNAFDKYLYKVFQDKTLADLSVPVYINATNIATGKLHFFDPSTKVVDAILASSAFPGIFSPYEIDNTLYSDGGIINNFPTHILKNKCDYMIGINVSPLLTIEPHKLNSIRSVATRAYELITAIHNIPQAALCDWLIEPEKLAEYSIFERNKKKLSKIFELGYQTAKESYTSKYNFEKAVL